MAMASFYGKSPAEMLYLDGYEGYCFNEACAYIQAKISQGEEPLFIKKHKGFSEFYSQFDN